MEDKTKHKCHELCIPEDGLHFMDCPNHYKNLEDKTKPEEWERSEKWMKAIEAANAGVLDMTAMRDFICSLKKQWTDEARESIYNECRKYCAFHPEKEVDEARQEERKRIVEAIKNMPIETVGNSANTVDQIIKLIL